MRIHLFVKLTECTVQVYVHIQLIKSFGTSTYKNVFSIQTVLYFYFRKILKQMLPTISKLVNFSAPALPAFQCCCVQYKQRLCWVYIFFTSAFSNSYFKQVIQYTFIPNMARDMVIYGVCVCV